MRFVFHPFYANLKEERPRRHVKETRVAMKQDGKKRIFPRYKEGLPWMPFLGSAFSITKGRLVWHWGDCSGRQKRRGVGMSTTYLRLEEIFSSQNCKTIVEQDKVKDGQLNHLPPDGHPIPRYAQRRVFFRFYSALVFRKSSVTSKSVFFLVLRRCERGNFEASRSLFPIACHVYDHQWSRWSS